MDEDQPRHGEFNPLFVGLLGIIAGAIIVVTYHIIFVRCCQIRRFLVRTTTQQRSLNNQERIVNTTSNVTCSYSKGYNEEMCSVCLAEFNEGERIRVLPECLHLFHMECIDTWLYSHPNCPLCRTSALMATSQLVLPLRNDDGGVQLEEIQHQDIVVGDA